MTLDVWLDYELQSIDCNDVVPSQHLDNFDKLLIPPDGNCDVPELASVESMWLAYLPVNYFVVPVLDSRRSRWIYFVDAQCLRFVVETVAVVEFASYPSFLPESIDYLLLAMYSTDHVGAAVNRIKMILVY